MRVREALFSILGARVAGATVWDLFAGSGALGLEALSRGAAHALFFDRDLSDVRRNCGWAESRVTLVQGDLGRFFGPGEYDVCFCDPPYAEDWGARLAAPLARAARPGGLWLYEHDKRQPPSVVAPWSQVETRIWGDVAVTFLRPSSGGERRPDSGDGQPRSGPTGGPDSAAERE
jgi:16S rRNA (guanine966-N2)-methyltransferase